MRRWPCHLVAIIVSALIVACTPSTEVEEGVATETEDRQAQVEMSPEEAMSDLAGQWDAGMNAADPEALVALYADQGAAMPPEQAVVTGKEELRSFFEDFLAAGDVQVRDVVESVVADGDHLAAKGTYELSATSAEGETTSETGHWLGIAVREDDGSIKLLRNIWNSDASPPGAPEPPPIAESGPAPATDAACHASPTALDQAFEADLEAGNVAALVAAHTEDGSRIPPGMSEMSGHEELAAYLASRIEPFSERVLDLTEISEMVDGSLGVTHGRYRFDYTPAEGGEHVTDQGKYLAVSRKGVDGCWRLHWVLWNADEPSAT